MFLISKSRDVHWALHRYKVYSWLLLIVVIIAINCVPSTGETQELNNTIICSLIPHTFAQNGLTLKTLFEIIGKCQTHGYIRRNVYVTLYCICIQTRQGIYGQI